MYSRQCESRSVAVFPCSQERGKWEFSFITSLLNLNVFWLRQLTWNTYKFFSLVQLWSHLLWILQSLQALMQCLEVPHASLAARGTSRPTGRHCPAVPRVQLFVCLNLFLLVSLSSGNRGKKTDNIFKKKKKWDISGRQCSRWEKDDIDERICWQERQEGRGVVRRDKWWHMEPKINSVNKRQERPRWARGRGERKAEYESKQMSDADTPLFR